MFAPAQNIRSFALDVDAEIVGVELQLVAFVDAAILIDVEGKRGNGAVEGESPVLIAARLTVECDH